LSYGVAGGRLDIAMRYVRGAKLAELLSKYGSLGRNTRWALGILGPVAGAQDTAHDAGLVHRDVKPSRLTVNRWLLSVSTAMTATSSIRRPGPVGATRTGFTVERG